MNLELVPSDYFAAELKRLAKRYRGFADDYEAFLDSLKVTYNTIIAEQEGKIYLLLIYDKADASSVKMNVVKQIVKDLGF